MRACEIADHDAAIRLLDQLSLHYERTRGKSDRRTVEAKRELANRLSASGDHFRAWSMHEGLLEDQLQQAGVRDPETTIAAWNLFITLKDAQDRRRARETLRDCLIWLLSEEPTQLHPAQRRLIPAIAWGRRRVKRWFRWL